MPERNMVTDHTYQTRTCPRCQGCGEKCGGRCYCCQGRGVIRVKATTFKRPETDAEMASRVEYEAGVAARERRAAERAARQAARRAAEATS